MEILHNKIIVVRGAAEKTHDDDNVLQGLLLSYDRGRCLIYFVKNN